MSRRRLVLANVLVFSSALVLTAFAADRRVRVPRDDPRFSGGLATTAAIDDQAYRQPVEFLNTNERNHFRLGETLFDDLSRVVASDEDPEVGGRLRRRGIATSRAPGGRDGNTPIGPLSNANHCQNCHPLNGRGSQEVGYYHGGEVIPLHISAPGTDDNGGPLPHPIYGSQIQTRSSIGDAEVLRITGDTKHITGRYEDGEEYKLMFIAWALVNPQHGPTDDMLISPRFAPPVFGLGLLEAVADDTIRDMADEEDKDGDGISGKANIVYDITAKRDRVGRFGWKAQQPTVRQQIAASARLDHGLTTSVFPEDDLTEHQRKMFGFFERIPRELKDEQLGYLETYLRSVGVPIRRDLKDEQVIKGDELFTKLDCAKCHVPKLTTGTHELAFLAGQTIYPYSDLLLHDMGHELSDDRPVYEAEGSEWRTPPLWGIGLAETVGGKVNYLHDGRARTLEEAILWHGGEAEKSREEFKKLSKDEREAVLAFLKSL